MGRCFGSQPRAKVSMMSIRPPQHGHGRGSTRGSSAAAASAVSGSFGRDGTASSLRACAMFAARLPLASNPKDLNRDVVTGASGREGAPLSLMAFVRQVDGPAHHRQDKLNVRIAGSHGRDSDSWDPKISISQRRWRPRSKARPSCQTVLDRSSGRDGVRAVALATGPDATCLRGADAQDDERDYWRRAVSASKLARRAKQAHS